MKIGIWELLIVLAIALLIFGPKALPKLGESMGKTIGMFKKGLSDEDEKKTEAVQVKSEDNSPEEK